MVKFEQRVAINMKTAMLMWLYAITCLALSTTKITYASSSDAQQPDEPKETILSRIKPTKEQTEEAKSFVNAVNEMVIFLWENSRFKDQEIPRGIMSDNKDGRYNFSYYGKSASSFYTVDSLGRVITEESSETSDLTNAGEMYAVAINIICEITQFDCAELTKELSSSLQNIFSGAIAEANQDEWRKAREQSSMVSELVAEARRLERSGRLDEAISNYTKALKIDPDNAYNLNSRGVVLSKNGDTRGAIDDYNKALKISPEDTLILMNRAKAWDKLNEYRKAIKDLDKLIRINAYDANAFEYRSSLQLQLGDIDAAFLDSKKAKQLGSEEAYDKLYDYIDSQQKANDKLELISRIIRDTPVETFAYFVRGGIHYEKGEYRRALTDFNAVTEAASDYAPGYMMQGMSLYGLGDTKNAIIKLSKAIKIDPNYSDAINNRGIAYMTLSQYKIAITEFTKAIEINPNNPSYFSNRCEAELSLSNHKKAIADCSKSISLENSQSNSYLARGRAQLALGNLTEARNDIDTCIANGGDSAEAFYWSGITEYQLENYKQSIRRMHQVLRINPSADGALVARAQSWIQLKMPNYALDDLRLAIQINPQNQFAYANEGYVLKQLKQFQDSISSYNKAIEIDSMSPASYVGRGISKHEVGESTSACKDWLSAKNLGSTEASNLYKTYCLK